MFLHAGLGLIPPKWLLPSLSVALLTKLWRLLWLTAWLGFCPRGKPALSPPCWPCHHLPLLSRAGWEKALGIFHFASHTPKKRRQMPKKEENKSQAKHRHPAASVAIAETSWQKSFPVCATGSSLELFAKVGSGFACSR